MNTTSNREDAMAAPEFIKLRSVEPEDADFLLELYCENNRQHFSATGLPESQLTPLLQMQHAAQCAAYKTEWPNATHQIVLFENAPVGQLRVQKSEDSVRLVDISLRKSARNQGIGSYVLETLLTEATQANKNVLLKVARGNPAQRLYERLGFVKVGDDQVYVEMRFGD